MKISKLKRGDVISVKWIDSMSTGRWYSERELNNWEKENEDCHSVGRFFKVTKDFFLMYMNTSPIEFGNIIEIPKQVITSIKLLKRFK